MYISYRESFLFASAPEKRDAKGSELIAKESTSSGVFNLIVNGVEAQLYSNFRAEQFSGQFCGFCEVFFTREKVIMKVLVEVKSSLGIFQGFSSKLDSFFAVSSNSRSLGVAASGG